MEQGDQTLPSFNKPSGIPRASKLPILTSKRSQVSLQDVSKPVKPYSATRGAQKEPTASSASRLGPPVSRPSIASAKPAASTKRSPGNSRISVKSAIDRADGSAPLVKSHVASLQRDLASHDDITSSNSETKEDLKDLNALDDSQPQQEACDVPPPEATTSTKANVIGEHSPKRKPPRPSLSDRTIESLQNLPATPKERRQSNFFSPVDSPMGPPPRPASSLSRNESSNGSRPTTSDGGFVKPGVINGSRTATAPASAKALTRASIGGSKDPLANPNRRSVSAAFTTKLQGNRAGLLQSPSPSLPSNRESPAKSSKPPVTTSTRPPSKTVASKPPRSRPSLSETFASTAREQSIRQQPSHTAKSPPGKSVAGRGSPRDPTTPNASSVALREQIAAAKAAARKERANINAPGATVNGGISGIDLHADPFGQALKDPKHILRNRINAARMNGRLNIAALALKDIPAEVLMMYDAKAMEESKVNWAEVVDLTKLTAADNEIEGLGESVFPDKSAEDFESDDQSEGNQFGGLESLNLHANRLRTLPLGLRRLERLTFLSLGYNKLDNSAFDVITQIKSLKELMMGHNALSGALPASIGNLRHLQHLDLQENRVLSLPEAVRELVSLRVLNLAKNQLTSVPMEAFQEVPLKDLTISDNTLISSLFPTGGRSGHPTLQYLSVANNSLAALTFDDTLELPLLQGLNVTNNHLKGLPPLLFPDMVSLMVGGNKLNELPTGFASLQKLRFADFSGNNIRLIDNGIADMESLETLDLSSNPLRDKKFLTMNAADIKRDLKARQAQSKAGDDEFTHRGQSHGTGVTPSLTVPAPSDTWALKSKGVLDLAGRGYSDSINDDLSSFLTSNEVQQLHLQSNNVSAMPKALQCAYTLTTLNLSGSSMGSDYLSDALELAALRELDLSRCGLNELGTLLARLDARKLQSLNVAANKLSGGLPMLHKSYPALTSLFANDNRYTSITAEALRGLHVVNLASNNIEQLPAEVGLLWDEGLRSLEIGSNAFRMPNHRILEKGTEVLMRWLKERILASREAMVTEEVSGTIDVVS